MLACLEHKGVLPTNHEESFAACRRHAENGKPWACLNLATRYETGKGVGSNLMAARSWYETAAAITQAPRQAWVVSQALCALGHLDHGTGNYTGALRRYNTAATEHHNAVAIFSIGMMFKHGEGVGHSAKKATVLFLRGAELGHPESQSAIDSLKLAASEVGRDWQLHLEAELSW